MDAELADCVNSFFSLTMQVLFNPVNRWEEVVENAYALHLGSTAAVEREDSAVVDRLRSFPSNWSQDHDEELAQFLCCHLETDNENLGSIKNYVESIDVSSYSVSGVVC